MLRTTAVLPGTWRDGRARSLARTNQYRFDATSRSRLRDPSDIWRSREDGCRHGDGAGCQAGSRDHPITSPLGPDKGDPARRYCAVITNQAC